MSLDRRWDTDFLTVSHLIKSNTLGRVIEFESHYDRWDPTVPSSWKGAQQAGGGAIYSLGTHLLDQAVELFGMPKRITGFITPQRIPNPSGFEDSFTCLLHYDAILATIKAAAVSAELRQLRFWIRGDKGSFKKVILCPTSVHIRYASWHFISACAHLASHLLRFCLLYFSRIYFIVHICSVHFQLRPSLLNALLMATSLVPCRHSIDTDKGRYETR